MLKSNILFKITILFACVLFCSANIYAQNKLDKSGKKTGKWNGSFKNGKLRYSGQFLADIPVDTFYYYYPDGKLKTRLVWSDENESYATMYYSTGEKMAEGKYVNQKKSGNWITYGANETKVNEGNYIGGKKYEVWKTFYPNGIVSEEVSFIADLENGDYKSYYENGSIQQEASFINGYRQGKTSIYFTNGQIKIKGQFEKDVRDGVWTHFKEDGSIFRKVEFDLGKRITPLFEDEELEDIDLFRENIKDDLEYEDMQGTIRYDKERR